MRTITYLIHLQEPVLVTAPGGDPNSDNSYGYIPGSVLRGALVRRYLEHGYADEEERFTRLFLNERVRYLNAYPVVALDENGKRVERALPTPRSWVLEKDDDQKTIYDRSAGQNPGLPKRIKENFVHVGDGAAVAPRPTFELAVHTARNRKMGRAVENDPGSAIYRYRALAPGQRFAAAIVVDSAADAETDAALLYNLLDDADLLLGGSQSAGYGLTTVVAVEELDQWREVGSTAQPVTKGDEALLYLASDAILRDPETGREHNDLLAALPPPLRQRLIPHPGGPNTFTDMTWVGGFNTTWGLPLPQSWAVQKGSVWRLQATGDVSQQEIEALEGTGVGERRAEGFGRVALNPPWLNQARHLSSREPHLFAQEEPVTLDGEAAGLLDLMNRRLMQAVLDRRVVEKAQQKVRRTRGRLSKSQLARLRLRLRNQGGEFSAFRAYLEGTRQRKSADDQFHNFYVGGRNFRDWLQKMADEPRLVWQELLSGEGEAATWQPVTIGDYQLDQSDDELTHHYVVRFIDAVCEQLAKKDRGNGRA